MRLLSRPGSRRLSRRKPPRSLGPTQPRPHPVAPSLWPPFAPVRDPFGILHGPTHRGAGPTALTVVPPYYGGPDFSWTGQSLARVWCSTAGLLAPFGQGSGVQDGRLSGGRCGSPQGHIFQDDLLEDLRIS
jgi:hypothetical protein